MNSPGSTTSSISVTDYMRQGPHPTSQLPPISFNAGQGKSGPLDCTFRLFLPQGQAAPSQRWPLVVLSAGFLLHSGLYGSYANDLASWGLAVVLYDLPELVDDMVMVSAIGSIIDACTSDPRVSPFVDPRAILLAGHSRGGKLSVLTAASDPRVKGIALLDPVDVTAMTPMGPGYPSALPAMRVACGPPRRVPALVVGAGRNADVIPKDANFRRFVSSCPGPCWSLEIVGAGHLQFLDMRVDLFSAFVQPGPTPDEVVRRVSKAALLAWALELALPLARGEAVDGRQVLARLQQTSAAIERQTPVSYLFKGFETLGASSTGNTAASTRDAASNSSGSFGASGSSSSNSGTGSSSSSSSSSSSTSGSRGFGTTAGGASAGASSTSAGQGSGASRAEAGGNSRRRESPWSYEQLLRMKARELKAILKERGVDCSDCFEKEDLARRIVERC